jgi:hypothetical protein
MAQCNKCYNLKEYREGCTHCNGSGKEPTVDHTVYDRLGQEVFSFV